MNGCGVDTATYKLKKPQMMSTYQQSFRIDDLLTHKAIDQHQQPDHFHTSPHILTTSSPQAIPGGSVDQHLALTHHEESNGESEASGRIGAKRGSVSSVNDEDDEQNRKRKKARTAFSRDQVADLEKKFQEKKYLSSAERGELAERLKLSDMQVKTWFQNRRMKYKRQSEEAEMEMKSPKYPYGSFVSAYSGMAPLYVPMSYKPDNGMYYSYPSSMRSPPTPGLDGSSGFGAFQQLPNSGTMGQSPTAMLTGTLPTSLSSSLPIHRQPNTSPLARSSHASYPSAAAAATASAFFSNGVLTPVSSPNTIHGQHPAYFYGDHQSGAATAAAAAGMTLSAAAGHGVFTDWQRSMATTPTP